MPWSIESRDDEFCVIKDEDGEVEGCHATEEEAQAQLAALNIAEAESGQSESSESAELDVKQVEGESISQFVDRVHNTFFGAFERDAWIAEIFDSHVIVDTEGKLWRVNYMDFDGQITFVDESGWKEVEVTYIDKAAKSLAKFNPPKSLDELEPDFFKRMRLAAKNLLDIITFAEVRKREEFDSLDIDFTQSAGVGVKTVDGKPWHFTWSTNAFEDREGEIFSTKALETYVEESFKREDKGTFDFWHLPGTDFAKKEFQAVIGRFLVEAGPYLETNEGQRAKKFFQEYPDFHPEIAPEGWGASPEYKYLPEDRASDGVYDWLWIVKTSTLPRASAANFWTEGKQIIMNDEIRKAAVMIFGEEKANEIEQQGLKKTEELEEAGINHKSTEETPVSQSEATEPDEITMSEETLEAIAGAVVRQLDVDFGAVTQLIQASHEENSGALKAFGERLDALERANKAKSDNETPRYVLNLVKRASDSEETALKEDDKLNNQKPIEAKASTQGASAFFSR